MIDMKKPVFVYPEQVDTRGRVPVIWINNTGYKYHHESTAKGYVSRKSHAGGGVLAYPYEGRFGKGYVVFSPRYDTTNYCFVRYYLL